MHVDGIEEAQKTDEFCLAIGRYLTACGDLSRLSTVDRKLLGRVQGSLQDFVRIGDDKVIWMGDAIVVPPEIRQTLLTAAHNTLACGHIGAAATKTYVRHSGWWWPGRSSDVIKFVNQCTGCKALRGRPGRVENQRFPTCTIPFSWIHVDHIGPIDEDQGMKYVLVIRDRFSRLVRLYPSAAPDAASTCEALKDWITSFGAPEVVVADNGGAFIDAGFKLLLESYKIQAHYIAPYNPRANGHVERINRELKHMLRQAWSMNGEWVRTIDVVKFALNRRKHSRIGRSPHELVFGMELNMRVGAAAARHDSVQEHDRIRKAAAVAQRMAVEQYAPVRQGARPQHGVKVGDQVWIVRPWTVGLQAKTEGPFGVVRLIGHATLEVRREGRLQRVNMRRVITGAPERIRENEDAQVDNVLNPAEQNGDPVEESESMAIPMAQWRHFDGTIVEVLEVRWAGNARDGQQEEFRVRYDDREIRWIAVPDRSIIPRALRLALQRRERALRANRRA